MVRHESDMLAMRALVDFVGGDADAAYAAASQAWAAADEDPGERANYRVRLRAHSRRRRRPDEAIAAGGEVIRIGGSYLDRLRAYLAPCVRTCTARRARRHANGARRGPGVR